MSQTTKKPTHVTKTFPRSLLRDEVDILYLSIGKPTPEGWELLSDEIYDTSRWSVHHSIRFREPGQPANEAWEASYSRGATECQEERPWEYEEQITAVLVRETEKLVKVWEPVPVPLERPTLESAQP